MEIVFAAAFLAGVLTIASPCVLTVLPVLLSTASTGGRLRPLGIVLGFAASFTLFTLAFAGALHALALPASWLRWLAIVALGVFGLALLAPAWGRAIERALSPLARLASRGTGGTRRGFAGGLLIGSGLGLLWAPCAGPLIGFAIGLTATAGFTWEGVAISLAYTLGAGVPMLAVGYGARGFIERARAAGRTRGVEIARQAFGGLTVLAVVALLFGLDTRIQALVQRTLPEGYSSFLTAFERQPEVQRQIDALEERVLPAATAPAAAAKPEEKATMEPTSLPAPAAPTATPAPTPIVALSDQGPAAELTGISGWINSEPLTLESVRGKVVIVDFWTFGCYNCRNTRPHVRALYDKYHSQGLEIIGVHTPEFPYEKVPANVRSAAEDQGVNWPIALDPDFKTWRAYNNRYWPAFYFIDAQGRVRHVHPGEGRYDFNEKVVQQLLAEAGASATR